MIRQKLIDKFGNRINKMSCIYLDNGEERLRSFLKKCDTIIEIGTYQGVSAAILSEYAKKVYTFDIEELSLKKDIFEYLGIKNIEFTKIRNNKEKAEMIAKIIENEKVDLIFIDGEHYNGELKNDFEMSEKCERILVHDYSPNFKEVYDFCNNIGWKKEVNGTFCLLTKGGTDGKKSKQRKKRVRKVSEKMDG